MRVFKIGKFYITKSDPRELLKEQSKFKNITNNLENWLLNNYRYYIGSKDTYEQGKKFAYHITYETLQNLKKEGNK